MWHGAQRWKGPPEVPRQSPESTQHGPGIYMTTSVDTARKYAKGGGVLVRFEIDPAIQFLEDAQIPLDDAVRFVRSRPRLRGKASIIADLEANAARMRAREIWAEVLVNLFVNYRSITGDHGPALARFFTDRGIDAAIVTRGDDDWLVVMNPGAIRSWRVVRAGEAEDVPTSSPLPTSGRTSLGPGRARGRAHRRRLGISATARSYLAVALSTISMMSEFSRSIDSRRYFITRGVKAPAPSSS